MLEVKNITQIFGGVTALNDVSFNLEADKITGIIGPNGAGKTTLFNIITGIYSQTSGTVHFLSKDVSRLPAEQLAGQGMVRTFQNVELFGKMTVLENVMVGLHSRTKSGLFSCSFKMPWAAAEERKIREEAMYWLQFVDMAEQAEVQSANLPFGNGRFLEIARAMACKSKMILMDEPAAGLNSQETVGLAALIRRIRDAGVTVVLVEHDMELVMDICDHIVVLNLGQKLAEGTPREIQDNPEVVAAYLGEE